MSQADLIDTTEMYLKTIYELEEDGVLPLRARIVERLGHSGPTVSQTVGRMERDGLVKVCRDRHLELTESGRTLVTEVMRKHRLAELLLVKIIGMPWASAHDEACRWEHVMSEDVEKRLIEMLENPQKDPYGNPIPGMAVAVASEVSIEQLAKPSNEINGTISRIGEPIQASLSVLQSMATNGLFPGSLISVIPGDDCYLLSSSDGQEGNDPVKVPASLGSHLFLTQ